MLSDTFRSIKDMQYATVRNGSIILDGRVFTPAIATEAVDGDKVRVFKLPENLTFDGRTAIIVRVKGRDERWV